MRTFISTHTSFTVVTIVISAFVSTLSLADSYPCPPGSFRNFASTVFDGRDRVYNYISERWRYKKVRNLEFDKYFAAQKEFAELETLPAIPGRDDFERHIAWLESSERRALLKVASPASIDVLPTLESVMLHGNSRQKASLAAWSRKYSFMFEEKFTEKQLQRAAGDLGLILNDSRLELGELTRIGLENATERYLKSQYHAKLFEGGLQKLFGSEKILRDEVTVDKIKNLLNTTPGKWSTSSGVNVGGFFISKYVSTGLLVSLPGQKVFKIAAEDMALMIAEGFEKHADFMVKKYMPRVPYQIAYNTLKRSCATLSYLSWTLIPARVIQKHFEYQKKLNAKEKQ